MKILVFSILFLSISFASKAQTTGVKVDGEIRRFTMYIPKSIDTSRVAPLVINFHGSGMTAIEQMLYTKMNKTADKYGFIAVYPQGQENNWNVGFEMDYDKGSNDVAFIRVLIEKLKKNYNIDEQAIFATGLSRGGFFTHRLAVELPDVIAAIAPVGAPIPNKVKERHSSKEKMPVLLAHGDADGIVIYNGKDSAYLSVDDTINYWRNHNQNSQEAILEEIDTQNDDTTVLIKRFSGAKPVVLIQIKNGGHTWPGADDFNIGLPLGKTTQDISFNDMMWNFFDKNRK